MRNFTPEDFSGTGQYIVRMTNEELYRREQNKEFSGIARTSFLSTIMYKVGYINNNFEIGNGNQLTTLISMADGWTRFSDYGNPKDENQKEISIKDRKITIWQDEEEITGVQKLCNHLNAPWTQEMRFATQEEIVRTVLYQKSRWR